ncbi:MAG: hypothetical protein BGN85_08720 [Alphaproteobacteria bacterium 64-11]|nr:MAG: hypothetical protein BGN85_08720 [Alphaproteobacteria bacterium 64-11]
MSGPVERIPSFGFARGAIVGRIDGGPNMLVVRQTGERTLVVTCEGNRDGTLRLRDVATAELEQRLSSHTPAAGAEP